MERKRRETERDKETQKWRRGRVGMGGGEEYIDEEEKERDRERKRERNRETERVTDRQS